MLFNKFFPYLPRLVHERATPVRAAYWMMNPPIWAPTWYLVHSNPSFVAMLCGWISGEIQRRRDNRRGLVTLEQQMIVTKVDPRWSIKLCDFPTWLRDYESEVRDLILTNPSFKGFAYFANPWLDDIGAAPIIEPKGA